MAVLSNGRALHKCLFYIWKLDRGKGIIKWNAENVSEKSMRHIENGNGLARQIAESL